MRVGGIGGGIFVFLPQKGFFLCLKLVERAFFGGDVGLQLLFLGVAVFFARFGSFVKRIGLLKLRGLLFNLCLQKAFAFGFGFFRIQFGGFADLQIGDFFGECADVGIGLFERRIDFIALLFFLCHTRAQGIDGGGMGSKRRAFFFFFGNRRGKLGFDFVGGFGFGKTNAGRDLVFALVDVRNVVFRNRTQLFKAVLFFLERGNLAPGIFGVVGDKLLFVE